MKNKIIKSMLAAGMLVMMPLSDISVSKISADVNDIVLSSENALDFDIATKNYVEMSEGLGVMPDTFETWVKIDSVSQRQIVFGNYVYGENGFALEFTADNKLRWFEAVWENGVNKSLIDVKIDGAQIGNGEWMHLAVVRDVANNKITFYKNGELLSENVLPKEGLTVLKDDFAISKVHYAGTDSRKSIFFDGELSRIRTWTTQRSDADILNNYSKEMLGNEEGLQNEWEFDINNLNVENNVIANKVVGAPIGICVNFKLPEKITSLDFDSAAKSSVIFDSPLTKAPKVIEFRAKLDKNPNKRQLIFSNYVTGKEGMGVEITANNQLRYVEFNYESNKLLTSVDVKTEGANICSGTWAHFALIRDTENQKLIVLKDGVKILEKAFDVTSSTKLAEELNFTTNHYVGTDARATHYFDGEMDSLTLWETNKSEAEIIQNMNQKITGNETGLLNSWDFDINALNTAYNVIPDKKADGINAKTNNFTLPQAPLYDKKGTDFSANDIEVEMIYELEEAPLTFETWLKLPKSNTSGRSGVIAGNLYDAYMTQIPIVNMEIFNNGVPRVFWTIDGNTYDYKANGVNVCTGEWTHLAITYDKEQKKMITYVNGEKVHESAMDFVPEKLVQPFKIGKDSRKEFNFKGELADLRIWSTTRSVEQIQTSFNDTVAANADGLMGNWQLDKQEDGTFIDSSINENHATNYWIDGDLFAKSADGYSSIAIIPDTQTLSMSSPESFTKMTTWLKNNASRLGIEVAAHVGDIVNTNSSQSEWNRAVASMNILDNVIPYVFSYGNHDTEITKIDGVWWGTRNAAMMNKNMPYSKFSKADTFGGAYEEGKMDNTYSIFTMNNIEFLILSLEESPREEVLEWAAKITDENPDKRVIITTHEYMYYDGNPINENSQDHLKFVGGSTTGEEMWDKYIKNHENIIAVISGHVGYPDLIMKEREGVHGNKVQQILCDAQFMDRDDINNGDKKGLGMVMLLSFKNGSDDVQINWYSTVREQFFRGRNQFASKLNLTSELQVKVDKSDLDLVLKDASEKQKSDEYKNAILSARTTFDEVLKDAQKVMQDKDCDQATVDSMVNRLNDAIANLKNQMADKDVLKSVYETYSKYDLIDYKDGIEKDNFIKKLKDAKKAIDDEEIMQEDADKLVQELNDCAKKLISDRSKKDLIILVEEVINYEESNYESGWNDFISALNNAKEVMNNKNAKQSDYFEALNDLRLAKESLRIKEDNDKDNDEDSDKDSDKEGTDVKVEETTKPATNDTSSIFAYWSMLLVSVGLLLVNKLKHGLNEKK